MPPGVQEPRLRVVPRWRWSDGADACFLAASYGVVADDWQALIIDDVLAVDERGRLVAGRCGFSVPRQNGKNGALEIIELYKLVVLGRSILHTAHEVKTARKSFMRMAGFFENPRKWPELARMVKQVRRANGQESIVLHSAKCGDRLNQRCECKGASIEYIARSIRSGRGYTVDDLVLDEAQELSELAYAALGATVSAAPSGDPQRIMCGTPPGPQDDAEVFSRLRKDALAGSAERVAWLEWSRRPGTDPDDRAEWARANPAIGTRVGVQAVIDERAGSDDATFIRERLGAWPGDTSVKVIQDHVWESLRDPQSRPGDRIALAVDVTPESTAASVAVASQRPDGRWHVELVEQRTGTEWVPRRVAEIVSRNGVGAVVVDGASPAIALAEPMQAQGVVVTVAGVRDMGQACGSLYRLVHEDGLRHVGQPQLGLSVSQARRRAIGREGLWAWGRAVSAADISPVVAVTLAVWGGMSSRAGVQRHRRSGRAVFRG